MSDLGDHKSKAAQAVALRLMRSSCELPTLHPSCPYREELPAKIFDCNLQCEELLASLDPTHPSSPQFEYYPLRITSRDSSESSAIFDAGEITIRDQAKPPAQCHVTSLMRRLEEQVSKIPLVNSRFDGVSECLRELDRRGLPAEPIFKQYIAAAVTISCLMVRLLPDKPPEMTDETYKLLGNILRAAKIPMEGRFKGDMRGLREFVYGFICSVPFDLLLDSGIPNPATINFDDPVPPQQSSVPDEKTRWIIDRFTKTYLHDWKWPSLRHEKLFMQNDLKSDVPVGVLHTRQVNLSDLNGELADRSITSSQSSERYESTMIEILKRGQIDATLDFCRAIKDAHPEDPLARNNYAFCLIPSDPEKALAELTKAHELLQSSNSLIEVNRVFALFRLGRYNDALDLAEGVYLESQVRHSNQPAFLWDMRSPAAELIDTETIPYLIELAKAAADQVGELERKAYWLSKRNFQK